VVVVVVVVVVVDGDGVVDVGVSRLGSQHLPILECFALSASGQRPAPSDVAQHRFRRSNQLIRSLRVPARQASVSSVVSSRNSDRTLVDVEPLKTQDPSR
jgi:hypothetical protein